MALDQGDGLVCFPLIDCDRVYFLNSVGVLFCLDLATGKELYAERAGSGCWISPVVAGERIYLFGRDGVTTVVKAGPKFTKLATNRLWDATNPDAAVTKPDAPTKGVESDTPPKKDDNPPRKQPGRTPAAFGDPITYGAALVDGAIFIRTGTMLYAVRSK